VQGVQGSPEHLFRLYSDQQLLEGMVNIEGGPFHRGELEIFEQKIAQLRNGGIRPNCLEIYQKGKFVYVG
jgi:hypothetical protein